MFYFDANKPFKGCYATVWSVENKDGFIKGRISTSRKKLDESYVNSNWFVNFGKGISEKALTLKERDRIFIDTISFENPQVEKNGEKKSYLNVNIQHFFLVDEMTGDGGGNSTPASKSASFPKTKSPIKEMAKVEEEDSTLPFDL